MKDRLEEIRERLAKGRASITDVAWLLSRLEKAEAALRYIAGFRARLSPKDIPTSAFDAVDAALDSGYGRGE